MAARLELIGDSARMNETKRLIERVAASPTRTVLIYGETGTGKGLAAQLLHYLSSRAAHEFVDVNCAAIPSNRLESEWFGHEKGAFTGAITKKTGLIEVANGGTVFLDEIREMALGLQAKLLSLLDTQHFRRVGAIRSIEADVRFIAATNQILFGEVHKGEFREDLYYRLQVVAINIPPLRERGDDIFILADHFIRVLGVRYQRDIRGMERRVEEIFRSYSWPGNVRELENLLERIFVLEDEDQILVRHIPDRIMREVEGRNPPAVHRLTGEGTAAFSSLPFHEATAAFQRQLIIDALDESDGGLLATARTLGLSRHALRHQMQKLAIRG